MSSVERAKSVLRFAGDIHPPQETTTAKIAISLDVARLYACVLYSIPDVIRGPGGEHYEIREHERRIVLLRRRRRGDSAKPEQPRERMQRFAKPLQCQRRQQQAVTLVDAMLEARKTPWPLGNVVPVAEARDMAALENLDAGPAVEEMRVVEADGIDIIDVKFSSADL
jgi:hypothetical protein